MSSAIVDRAVADARDLPELVANFRRVDPALAGALEGKALIESRTPWGTLMVAGVSWIVAHYGLGWSQDTCALIGGLGLLAGSYVMRALSSGAIRGVFAKPEPAAKP